MKLSDTMRDAPIAIVLDGRNAKDLMRSIFQRQTGRIDPITTIYGVQFRFERGER